MTYQPHDRSEAKSHSKRFDCSRAGLSRSAVLFSSLLLLMLVVSGYKLYLWLEDAQSSTCKHKLKSIGLTLLNYHANHGTFPPAYLCDKAGKPINSWRAEVFPSFAYNFRPGRDDYAGGPGYDYAEPWNGPKNAKMNLDKDRWSEIQCRSQDHVSEPAITDYVAVVGPNTMWAGCEPVSAAADGSDKDKILLIEVINSDIVWMEPQDLTLQQALDNIQPKKGIGIGSHHRDGIHYFTVGGEVKTLDPNIDRESLRKLLVRDSAKAPAEESAR
jgi:hypothetical protein